MAQELQLVPVSVPATFFSEEELNDFVSIRVRAQHFIEMECGCTDKRHGDISGILRISDDGNIRVFCQCSEQCRTVPQWPEDFAKHASNTSRVPNWRNKVWVHNREGKKVKVSKTCLLRYYNGDKYKRPRGTNNVHRDQFLTCSGCHKQRRFQFRSEEVFRFYHDALARQNSGQDIYCWDMIPGWSCNEGERKMIRTGCPRDDRKCKGCPSCVCFGCRMCRFEDCNCRSCLDFYRNAPL